MPEINITGAQLPGGGRFAAMPGGLPGPADSRGPAMAGGSAGTVGGGAFGGPDMVSNWMGTHSAAAASRGAAYGNVFTPPSINDPWFLSRQSAARSSGGFSADSGSSPISAAYTYGTANFYLRRILETDTALLGVESARAAPGRHSEGDLWAYHSVPGNARSSGRFYTENLSNGSGLGIPPPPMPWPTATAGGGGGGGSGGGSGSGFRGGGGGGPPRSPGGGGSGFQIPGANFVGLGATSKALTGGFTAAALAVAAEELFFLPQTFGSLEGSSLGNAAPYRNLVFGASALGRAGGFSGPGLVGSMYDGVKAPAWMARLGLGPTEALGTLSRFGIVQHSNEANQALIEGIAGTQFKGPFSGLNVEGSMAQAARYGMISGDAAGIQQYTQQLAPVLTNAVAMGMDRASILRSIDSAIGSVARGGGIGVTPGSVSSFISQYSSLPGGLTGEAGLSAAGQLQSATASVGTDRLRTTAFMEGASRLKTPAQLSAFLDKGSAGYYDRFKSNPVGAKMLDYYFQAQANGETYLASSYLAQIVSGGGMEGFPGNPGAERDLLTNNSVVGQLPERWRPMAGGATGLTPGNFIAGGIGQGADVARQAHAYFASKGMPEAAIAAIIGGMQAESGLNPSNTTTEKDGSISAGLFQWNKGRLDKFKAQYGHMPGMGPNSEQFEFAYAEMRGGDAGAARAYAKMMSTNDIDTASDAMTVDFENPVLGTKTLATRRGYSRAAYGAYARGPNEIGGPDERSYPGNIPTDALQAQSDAMAGAMHGSEVSFAEMNAVIPQVNASLSQMKISLDSVTKWANDFAVQNGTKPGTMPYYLQP